MRLLAGSPASLLALVVCSGCSDSNGAGGAGGASGSGGSGDGAIVSGAFCGLAAECAPVAPAEGSGPDEPCEGSTLVFCSAGRVERIDCVALGFEGCNPAGGQGCVPGLVPR